MTVWLTVDFPRYTWCERSVLRLDSPCLQIKYDILVLFALQFVWYVCGLSRNVCMHASFSEVSDTDTDACIAFYNAAFLNCDFPRFPPPPGLALLMVTSSWSAVTAQQTVQSGLLYWASLVEGGSNFAYLGVAPGMPRTAFAIYDTNQSSLVPAAHLAALKTNNQAYNFSNGEITVTSPSGMYAPAKSFPDLSPSFLLPPAG